MPLTPFQKEVMSVLAAERHEASHMADEQPDTPIGVAFVDAKGEPGWIRRDPALRVHHPSLRGCWPVVH